MIKRAADNGYFDSGAETAESDYGRMSTSGSRLMASRARQRQQQQPLLMNLHLLANPGDSLLLQHSLERLLRWLCPSLRIFHVSERAAPFTCYSRPRPSAGYPSVAITFFLHEAYGEERILKVLDFFQRPPWQYHHTESCGVPVSSSSSSMLRPYLLPSRDFYSLGAGMPVWGVRPVHCGGEILRVTLYSGYDNYQDAVRLYETVLQRRAEEQKPGFCWFTLHAEPGLCLQLAVKQLSPGVRVEPCSSAVLQFAVEEIGQLVPLLPNPCSPISPSRWQTEDLDGNKVLFQVNSPAQPRPLTCAFPPICPSVSPRGMQPSRASSSSGQGHSLSPCSFTAHRQGQRAGSDPLLEKLHTADSCCSSPPGSSCYSSQRSSPAHLSSTQPDSPLLRPSISCSLSHLLLEEEEDEEEEEEEDEEEPETNVDTGAPVPFHCDTAPTRSSSSSDLRPIVHSDRPAAVGASAAESLAQELMECLPRTHHAHTQGPSSRTWGSAAHRTDTDGRKQSPRKVPLVENRTTAGVLLSPRTRIDELVDEFFI